MKLGTVAVDCTKVKANASRNCSAGVSRTIRRAADAASARFGVPEDKAQENFTDPHSRIMKRAGGGFDASYNAQTAVDEAAHIVVAAELTNIGSDAAELPKMLAAIKINRGQAPRQALADTGYRSEAVFEQLARHETQIAVSMGREGKQQVQFHRDRNPYSAAMAAA